MSQGPINSGIQGFLSYLGLKQQGQNVSALADQVIPTLNIDPFYQLGSEIPLTGFYTTAASNVIEQQVATIPEGKAWMVTKVGAYFVSSVGNDLFPYIQYRRTFGTTTGVIPLAKPIFIYPGGSALYVPTYAQTYGEVFTTPVMLHGGASIWVSSPCILALNQQWSFFITYKEIDL